MTVFGNDNVGNQLARSVFEERIPDGSLFDEVVTLPQIA